MFYMYGVMRGFLGWLVGYIRDKWGSESSGFVLGLLELVGDAEGCTCQVTYTQILHIFERNPIISIDIKRREERINILLLRIIIRIKNTIGIGQNRISLSR